MISLLQNRESSRWQNLPCFALLIAFLFNAELRAEGASSDLLSHDALAGCECHVVGIYMPEKAQEDDRVYVKIQSTGKPMAVVLCSYSDTQWNLEIEDGADVRQIIVSGWFEQAVVGAPADIPTKLIVGSSNNRAFSQDYFWGYAWETKEGRNVRAKVKQFTGLEVTTFQGVYQGKQFVIDGRTGRLAPSVKTKQPMALTTDQRQDKRVVEEHVRRLFEIDMKERQTRIAQAEEDLNRIKAKFAKRQAASEQIIASQIDALMKADTEMREETKPRQVANPTIEGWRLWQQSKWQEALPLFVAGTEKDPKDAAAWNGLGWTRFHLGEWDGAITAFDRALKLEPKQGGALNGRGRVFMILGKLDEAEADLSRSTKEIIEEYGEARAVQLEVTAAWFGLVEVNLAQKDFATAREWAERYLKHKPDDVNMKRLLEKAKE